MGSHHLRSFKMVFYQVSYEQTHLQGKDGGGGKT